MNQIDQFNKAYDAGQANVRSKRWLRPLFLIIFGCIIGIESYFKHDRIWMLAMPTLCFLLAIVIWFRKSR
ncbi:MAG TPA: hypothetical protein VG897_04545 [Terriglobales bacterium]|nr:hypothetical protein [Terriglobales bacterium]